MKCMSVCFLPPGGEIVNTRNEERKKLSSNYLLVCFRNFFLHHAEKINNKNTTKKLFNDARGKKLVKSLQEKEKIKTFEIKVESFFK